MEKLLEVLPDRDRIQKVERAKAQSKPSKEGLKHATAGLPPIASKDAVYLPNKGSSAPIPAALADAQVTKKDPNVNAYSQFGASSSIFNQTPMYKDRPTSPRKEAGTTTTAGPAPATAQSPSTSPRKTAAASPSAISSSATSVPPVRPKSPRALASSTGTKVDPMDADVLRLEKLKLMYEKELITKEEYESRRRAILDEMMGIK